MELETLLLVRKKGSRPGSVVLMEFANMTQTKK